MSWIECNLPFSDVSDNSSPDLPDLSDEERATFGATRAEASARKDEALVARISNWWDTHPKMQEWLATYHESTNPQKTFCGQGLNKPGTVIEVDGKTYLIGDINLVGGTCDDCMDFLGSAIVTRYRLLPGLNDD